jgi:hypothetical protein
MSRSNIVITLIATAVLLVTGNAQTGNSQAQTAQSPKKSGLPPGYVLEPPPCAAPENNQAQLGSQPLQGRDVPGRYQIIITDHPFTMPEGTVTVRDILRIDTYTGAAVAWRNGVDRNKNMYSEWDPIK